MNTIVSAARVRSERWVLSFRFLRLDGSGGPPAFFESVGIHFINHLKRRSRHLGKTSYLRDPYGHHSNSPRLFHMISADRFQSSYEESTEFSQGVRVVCQKLFDLCCGSSNGSRHRRRDVQG